MCRCAWKHLHAQNLSFYHFCREMAIESGPHSQRVETVFPSSSSDFPRWPLTLLRPGCLWRSITILPPTTRCAVLLSPVVPSMFEPFPHVQQETSQSPSKCPHVSTSPSNVRRPALVTSLIDTLRRILSLEIPARHQVDPHRKDHLVGRTACGEFQESWCHPT